MANEEPSASALREFHDRLRAAYGPQHWWPVQDTDNPRFEILVGAVLTQHTAWTNVEMAIATLLEAGSLQAQALLAHEDLPQLIRRAGPHNIKAKRLRALCTWFVEQGGFDALQKRDSATLRRELLALHGIGHETADVILLYAFQRPVFVADAYAFRIMERYGWTSGTRNYERLRRRIEQAGPAGDAAFYDELHALIVAHAKQRCHKRKPDCEHCVLHDRCDHGRATIAGSERAV
ncbi:endonuclease III-like protein [Salinisphaera sp. T5B8]|uniref:endonuclease III domain-containing protein n=1 Tax=Salinisphaera sp. T5B8 TaxID=1304154 RepID=UPI003342336C